MSSLTIQQVYEMRKQACARMFSRKFWLDVRERVGLFDIGGGRCHHWSRKALREIENEPFSDIFFIAGIKDKNLLPSGLVCHYWIEGEFDNKIWIADLTAGQIYSRRLKGYYGYLTEANPSLARVYQAYRRDNKL